MTNFTLLNDRANFTLYLLRTDSTDSPGRYSAEQEATKKAQQWLIDHGVTSSCGMYASDLAVLLTTNGTCPVDGYTDRQKFTLVGSVAYAEYGGPAPTSAIYKKLKQAHTVALSRAASLNIKLDAVGVEDPDRMPQSWFNTIAGDLDIWV